MFSYINKNVNVYQFHFMDSLKRRRGHSHFTRMVGGFTYAWTNYRRFSVACNDAEDLYYGKTYQHCPAAIQNAKRQFVRDWRDFVNNNH